MPDSNIQTLDELSRQYATWVIQYRSKAFDKPLYMVWYTDTDEKSTCKLLCFKTGEMFATTSVENIKATILNTLEQFNIPENLLPWLDNFQDLTIVENGTFDTNQLVAAIQQNKLDNPTMMTFMDFINLYGDFVKPDARNHHLQALAGDSLICEAWDYTYDYIFWPSYQGNGKLEPSDKPALKIDHLALADKLQLIVDSFDQHIKLTD
jgi:hypothetical protein